jgi:hypothetical protein
MKIISGIQEYSNFYFRASLIPTEPVSGFSLYFGTTGVSGIFTTGIGFYGTGGMIFDNSGDLFGGYYSGRSVDIQGHLFTGRLSYFYDDVLIKNNLPSANNFNSIEFDKHGETSLDLTLNYITE